MKRVMIVAAFLFGCGTTEPSRTFLKASPYESMPLVADGLPSVIGGTLVDRVFVGSCTQDPHCVSYRCALPTAPDGMEVRVSVAAPIISVVGRPPCLLPVQVELTYSTDAWILPRALPVEQVAMERGATVLTVNLCFRGDVRAQLGDLSGTVSYARIQPLHR